MKDTLKPIRIGNILNPSYGTNFAGNVWDKDAIANALTTMTGGGREPMILETYEEDNHPGNAQ